MKIYTNLIALLACLILPSVVFILLEQPNAHVEEQKATTGQIEPVVVVPEVKIGSVTEMITRLSTENGFDVNTALRISGCESQHGKYKTNWQGSSAYGLYQFMPKTFNAYCDGVIESDYDQIMCFIKLYPEHKSWWACK